MSAKTESALVPAEQYAILTMTEADQEVMHANLAGGSIGQFDLQRVKVPTGGITQWATVDANGTDIMTPAIQGVVVGWHDSRQHWAEAFGGGNTPPDCVSHDLVVGVGDPGGRCASCRFAQWGSQVKQDGTPGRGQDCRSTRALLILGPNDILPTLLIVPPGSLKAVRGYFLMLTSKRIPYWGVITSFELTKTKNADGIEYAQMHPRNVQALEPESAGAMRALAEQFAPTLETVAIDRTEVNGE